MIYDSIRDSTVRENKCFRIACLFLYESLYFYYAYSTILQCILWHLLSCRAIPTTLFWCYENDYIRVNYKIIILSYINYKIIVISFTENFQLAHIISMISKSTLRYYLRGNFTRISIPLIFRAIRKRTNVINCQICDIQRNDARV